MPLKVKCDCGTVLTVPAQRIGKSVRCPSCSETVLIQPPEQKPQPQKPQSQKPQSQKPQSQKPQPQKPQSQKPQPQKPQSSKPKPPATKGSAPKSTDASKSDERRKTKPVKPTPTKPTPTKPTPTKPTPTKPTPTKPTPTKPTPAHSKGEDKPIADPGRQDHQDTVEPAKKTGGSQPTETVDESKPNSTQARKPKETEPQNEAKRQAGKDQSVKVVSAERKVVSAERKVVSAERKEDAQTSDEGNKPDAKSSEAEIEKTATAEKISKEETKPKKEAVEKKPTPSKSAGADANKDRRKPAPGRREEDKTEEQKPKENEPAATAKKLPPALKRATSSAKDNANEPSQTQSQPRKTAVTENKSKTSGSTVEKEKKPPPLKPGRSPVRTKPAAKVSSAREKKATAPPLRKPTSKPRADSKDQPKKTSPKWTSRLKRIKRSSAKSGEAADEQTRRRGVQHGPAKRWSAYYLAIGVIVVALFNMAPAFYEGFQAFRLDPPRPMARWAYAAVIVGLLQLAYAFYLIQLPDWGSVWVVAILSLAATTMYAALASAVVFGGQDSNLLESLQLNYVARKKAMLWCTIMLTLSAVLTYFAGRLAIRWQKAFSIAYPTTTNPPSS